MGKAESVNIIVESCKGLHAGKLLAWLGVKWHLVTNALAYYIKEFIANVKVL